MSRARRFWEAAKEALEWRAISTVVDAVLYLVILQSPLLALALGAAEVVVKTTVFMVWRYFRSNPA